ncbi:MAG: OprO/OprP family phosphate-selective porin [Brevinematales bacterium]|nr:OprO/OprP family phosphate-selective porin [Brevinematales bacterium]
MKRILLVCMLILASFGAIYSEVKLDSLIWFDTEAYVDTNQNFFVDKGGAFYIGRAYVNLRGDIGKDWFGNKIKGRLTVDFQKPTTPIKYAYFDWQLFSDYIVLSGGLMKSEFGFLGYWAYPIPVKDTADLLTLLPSESADFGMGISGKLLPIEGLTKNLFYYNIQVLNGEGYKKLYTGSTAPANDTFASHYSLVISPLNGTMIGGTYRLNPRDHDKSIHNLYWVKSDAYAFYISAKDIALSDDFKIPVDFLFQYVGQNTTYDGRTNINTPATNYTQTGYAYTIMLGYTFFDIFAPYVKYDVVDQNIAENKTNDMDQILYLGANIKIDPKGNLVMKPLYQYYLMKGNSEKNNEWLVKLEFEYKMGFSIWQ